MERKFNLHLGNCLDVLRDYPDNYVDSVITDPPYGLTQNKKGGTGVKSINPNSPAGRSRIGTGNGAGGFMGKKWDSDVPSVEIWAECLRVLKPGGNLLCFAGTRTQHRMVARIVESGFTLQDIVLWSYGSGFPKSLNVSKAIENLGGKVPTNLDKEPTPNEVNFCSWLRDNSEESVVRKVLGSRFWDCEVQIVNTATKENPRMGRRSLVPTADRWKKFKEVYGKEVPKEIEELAKAEPLRYNTPGEEWSPGKGVGTTGSGQWAGWGTALKPAYEPISIFTKCPDDYKLYSEPKRLYYHAKTSKRERNLGLTPDNTNIHPTVKPLKLMEQLCQLATPQGGTVLDPFMGSGTTGIAALNMGYNFIGIDMGKEYFDIASLRLNSLFPQSEE